MLYVGRCNQNKALSTYFFHRSGSGSQGQQDGSTRSLSELESTDLLLNGQDFPVVKETGLSTFGGEHFLGLTTQIFCGWWIQREP